MAHGRRSTRLSFGKLQSRRGTLGKRALRSSSQELLAGNGPVYEMTPGVSRSVEHRGVSAYGTWKNNSRSEGRTIKRKRKARYWPVDGGLWPPRARCVARMALCQGGRWLALPHLLAFSVKTLESMARHFLRLGPPSSDARWQDPAGWPIWNRERTENRLERTVASLDDHDQRDRGSWHSTCRCSGEAAGSPAAYKRKVLRLGGARSVCR